MTHSKTASLESYVNVNIPTSAPCSPPKNDLWGAYYMTPPGSFQVWSAPEMPDSHSNNHHKHTSSLETINVVHPLPLPPAVSMPTFPTPTSPAAPSGHPDLSGASLPSQSSTPVASAPSPISPIRATTRPHLMKIKSKWQKGKLIGRGTFGSVYVASNRETGALCAMKEVEMLPDDSKSAECIRQLEQEIKVLSRLKHPNIVQYYGSEIVGDKFYIYLEYVHPGSINKFIHDHCGAITESVVRNFTRHILCGLAYLHSKKTIHRDIKGANLLVDAYGVVKLADFGMAKHLNGQTAYLSLKGSPYWMAPELLQSAMQTDASSDVALAVDTWSLGCTIIEMMDGKPPWSEYEGAAAMFKVLKETPPIPETMSAEGKDFLQCCFRRNPAERPTASMLLDHPFVSYSNMPDACSQSSKEIKDSMMFLRERARYKQDQVPLPLGNTKGKLSNK
ncbi:mitogen-activated protein kinase kinase kinase 5 [Perilla frutescens var. hirtella]|uniref:mitogen-activated protein kinase kinase kinase n=1 Tax=Perilla frutescens var. hirtella TaxID=608512 RepID=A0AAD4J2L2_PERFH|nr:mitogen-activated protein kinase kinase kinase 5 [Perilla frutescens var. frutescens]KAH6825468.1 mitogen-activated protein kinase kinase kinase 5 [Perilla frutescens var. hirtella]